MVPGLLFFSACPSFLFSFASFLGALLPRFLPSLPTLLAVLFFHVFFMRFSFSWCIDAILFSLIRIPPCQRFPTPYPYTPLHLATLPRAIPNMLHLAALAEQAFGPQSAEASLPSFSCCFLLATERETWSNVKEFKEDSPHITTIYGEARWGNTDEDKPGTSNWLLGHGAEGSKQLTPFFFIAQPGWHWGKNKVTSC